MMHKIMKYLFVSFISSVSTTVLAKSVDTDTSIDSFSKPATVSIDKAGGMNVATFDDKYSAKISGFFQIYPAFFSGDATNQIPNFVNGIAVPAARMHLSGKIASDWLYKITYDFATNTLLNAYLQYTGFKHFIITGGQYKPAFSLGFLPARNDMTFLEYALPVHAFFTNYVLGAQLLGFTQHFTVAGGIFGPNTTNTINGVTVTGPDPVGVNGRLTYSPIHDERKVLHFGLGAYYRQANRATNVVRFRSIPELRGRTSVYLADTGNIANSRDYYVGSAEFAAIRGSFYAEAEYYRADVNRISEPDLGFNGYYMTAGYFLTGESRLYDFTNGYLKSISQIRNRYGAWEIAMRYSNLDLNDKNIIGGKERDVTAALNWYPVQRIKLGFNYIHANATPSGNGVNRQMNIYGLLLQVAI